MGLFFPKEMFLPKLSIGNKKVLLFFFANITFGKKKKNLRPFNMLFFFWKAYYHSTVLSKAHGSITEVHVFDNATKKSLLTLEERVERLQSA